MKRILVGFIFICIYTIYSNPMPVSEPPPKKSGKDGESGEIWYNNGDPALNRVLDECCCEVRNYALKCRVQLNEVAIDEKLRGCIFRNNNEKWRNLVFSYNRNCPGVSDEKKCSGLKDEEKKALECLGESWSELLEVDVVSDEEKYSGSGLELEDEKKKSEEADFRSAQQVEMEECWGDLFEERK